MLKLDQVVWNIIVDFIFSKSLIHYLDSWCYIEFVNGRHSKKKITAQLGPYLI